jgi:(R,R)-butanediol dehydrogenase / meso-butanediol dehydrogenase / diacetyl reductase
MKAVVLEDYGKVVLKDIPLKKMGPEDVKVKIAFCAVGANDPPAANGDIPWIDLETGEITLKLPYYFGYQASGIIEELGEKAIAMGLKVGDRVTLDQHVYCASCYDCRHGHEGLCLTPGYSYLDGLMAERVVVHQRQVFKIPDSVELEEATLTEIIGESLMTIDQAPFNQGDSIIIIGGGSCGLTLVQIARLSGAMKLTLVEPVEFKRKLALELGADYVIDPNSQNVVAESMKITGGRGFDRVFEASGDSKMLPLCIDLLAHCGRIVLLSIYTDYPKIVIPYDKFWFKEAGIVTVFGQSHMFPRAANILPRLNLRPLRGPIFPLDKFLDAFDATRSNKYVRVLLKC